MKKIIAISIDEYSKSPEQNLKNCLNDINSIVSILSTEYEYDSDNSEIILYTKPEQTTLSYLYKSLYEEFFNSLETDTILLIFAGHGEYNPHLKTGYWLCSDSNLDDPTTWFNINILLSFFSHSRAKNIALISDSCFSGSIFYRTRGGGIKALTDKKSRQALTSGGLEKVSDGSENDNSPFNKAIQLTLKQNENENLSFNLFCEITIRNFSTNRRQTPEYGSLNIDGDAGGTYIFKKKICSIYNNIFYKNMLLPLEIDKRININSNISIPFFSGNTDIDLRFINIYLQQLGYKIINDIRAYASTDIEHLIKMSASSPSEVESDYTIHRLDDEYLSISFSRTDYLNTLHPNYYIYSINFCFNPTRQVGLFDIFNINYKDGILDLIKKYAEDDCRNILISVLDQIFISELDFSFDDKFLFLYFTNHLIHAYKACGIVEIPLEEITFRST